MGSVAVMCGSVAVMCGSVVGVCGLSSCSTWALLLHSMGDLSSLTRDGT